MKFDKIKKELRESYNCTVLEGHFKNLFEETFNSDPEISAHEFFQEKFWPVILESNYRFYTEKTRGTICKKFEISKANESECCLRIEE